MMMVMNGDDDALLFATQTAHKQWHPSSLNSDHKDPSIPHPPTPAHPPPNSNDIKTQQEKHACPLPPLLLF